MYKEILFIFDFIMSMIMVFQEFPPKQGKGKVSGSIIPMTLKRLYVEMITGPCMKIAMFVRK